MIKCEYEGTGVWDGRCIGTKEVDPCTGYDKCKQYKPNYTTNADQISVIVHWFRTYGKELPPNEAKELENIERRV